jgi:two-component system nitrogen regulation sensor histidine kinase NtrY
MAFDIRRGAGGVALGTAVRAGLIAALAFGAFVALAHHLYATALIAAGIAGVIVLDLARAATAADRLLAQFVDGLMAEGYERPTPQPGLHRLGEAIDRALDKLSATRAERHQRIDYLEALTDNVAAALLVLDGQGIVVGANRAARLRLGEVAGPLLSLPVLGPEAAQRLLDLPPGAREIVQLADGRAMLAQVAGFSVPNGGPNGGRRRLIALQTVFGELDAVEVKAWQDLVRVLAHEMMNSLTPIVSLADSIAVRLREQGIPDDLAQATEAISRRGAGLMAFVDRYRQLADLPPPARSKFKLAELVARIDVLMAPLMTTAQVSYASRVEPPQLRIEADPDLLEQALINLLKNALDAVRGRPDAAVALSARLTETELVIVVEDNGPGLPQGDTEAVFVPFFTTKPGGSGVGLTLSRQIVLAHGGRIEHARRDPHGAIFRLVLPAG